MAIISQTQQTLENYRKFINGASSTIYIKTDGDDNGGNGSISYPFQTYQRAHLAAASMNPTNVGLQFGSEKCSVLADTKKVQYTITGAGNAGTIKVFFDILSGDLV